MDSEKDEKIATGCARVDRIRGRKVHALGKPAPHGQRGKPGERILEVGVGPGLALGFCPPECRVVGIDVSTGMLEKARKRARRYGFQHIELLHMDAADMDFEDGSFDTVMAANIDTAITDYRKAVMEMIRVCRPGGRIIMLKHFQRGSHVIPPADEQAISIQSLEGIHP